MLVSEDMPQSLFWCRCFFWTFVRLFIFLLVDGPTVVERQQNACVYSANVCLFAADTDVQRHLGSGVAHCIVSSYECM